MEIAPQRDLHQVRQGRREFHASRTCADQHESHLSRALVLVFSRCGKFKRAQDFRSDRFGVTKALQTRRISRELIVPEVAGAHAGRDHQIIERDLADARAWRRRLNRAGSNIDAGDLRQEYDDISLLRLELTDRCSDLSGREDRRRHLIEQRLKYVVVATVDENDLGIGVPQRVRRREPGKAAADDHDTLALRTGRVDDSCCLIRPVFCQHRTHGSPLFVLSVIL